MPDQLNEFLIQQRHWVCCPVTRMMLCAIHILRHLKKFCKKCHQLSVLGWLFQLARWLAVHSCTFSTLLLYFPLTWKKHIFSTLLFLLTCKTPLSVNMALIGYFFAAPPYSKSYVKAKQTSKGGEMISVPKSFFSKGLIRVRPIRGLLIVETVQSAKSSQIQRFWSDDKEKVWNLFANSKNSSENAYYTLHYCVDISGIIT